MFYVLFLFTLVQSEAGIYEYSNFYKSGEIHTIVFDAKNEKIISGDAYVHKDYEDCSDKKFKCIKIGNEYYFVPKLIERSGEFESPFGEYAVYSNEQRLPFSTNIEYKIITINPNSIEAKTFFYNSERGILAIIINNSERMSPISWLMTSCGLLADKDCGEKNTSE